MGHGKSDRPFLSASEHSGIYGAHSSSSGKLSSLSASFQPVSFDHCSLSFQPWQNPVCSPDCGTPFELTNLIPFLRKYSCHPITGKPFSLDDVVRLNFHKNQQGKWHDPVACKEFGEHSKLVAVGKSGNVFLWDTVQRLNIKAKFWRDLVSDEEFKKQDLIIVQDPEKVEARDPREMWHVKNAAGLTEEDRGVDRSVQLNTTVIASAKKVLSQLKPSEPSSSTCTSQTSKTAQEASTAYTRNKATGISTGLTAASFTSSSLTPRTSITRVELDNEELMFSHIKSLPPSHSKAYIRLTTNFGPLNLELDCDRAPKTCYNFLSLSKTGYYNDTIFHRNIPGFMIQGGDPTGTGRGGSSIWGTEFRDEHSEPGAYKHSERGVLSMANKGASTNTSQFFITYRSLPHLDGKHTVFGRLVDRGRDKTLEVLETIPSEEVTDRPIKKIKILDVLVTQDPFEKYQLNKSNTNVVDPNDPKHIKKMEKKKRRKQDRTTWLGTELPQPKEAIEKKQADLLKSSETIGKYMNPAMGKNKTESTGADAIQSNDTKKRKRGGRGGFGDFSGW